MRKHEPAAVAHVRGSEAHPDIRGCVRFRQMDGGVLVTAEIRGLPGGDGIFAFHIHSGSGAPARVPLPALAGIMIPQAGRTPTTPVTCRRCSATGAMRTCPCSRTALPWTR